MNRFLLIDKACGHRSTEVVSRVRRLLGRRCKVGHTGTLDSTASGLLVLLTGNLTRASSYVMALPKRYRVTLKFGEVTDTCDFSGQVLSRPAWEHITRRDVDRALAAFYGTRLQVPPKVSAIRVNGKRAHVLARNGGEPEIAPRPVVFTRVARESDLGPDGTLSLLVDCHQGTYIRSLVRDLGQRLKSGAHVLSLRREQVGPFSVAGALDSRSLFQEEPERALAKLESQLRPAGDLLEPFLVYGIAKSDEARLKNGQAVPVLKRKHFGLVPASVCSAAEGEDVISFGRLIAEKGGVLFVPKTNIFNSES